MKRPILLAILLASTTSHAVSRVGGGKVRSLRSGFEASIESLFVTTQSSEQMVRCSGPIGPIRQTKSFSTGTQYFEISEFADEFTNATALSKKQLTDRFEKSQWQEVKKAQCDLTLKQRTSGVVAYIVTWGHGKGFVMKGTDSPDTNRAMDKVLATLKITSECSWK
ncbi:hypothetical protein [Bdellovibrio sp. ZAP7]|uniref:hypothetical protein n=1 Tax=Bdellovibrio sp. ZAP7 TaxID=2231053 RepID=UPI001159C5AC|nr:hypothetical protein [Bdellovibrio sp. ZAP7]